MVKLCVSYNSVTVRNTFTYTIHNFTILHHTVSSSKGNQKKKKNKTQNEWKPKEKLHNHHHSLSKPTNSTNKEQDQIQGINISTITTFKTVCGALKLFSPSPCYPVLLLYLHH